MLKKPNKPVLISFAPKQVKYKNQKIEKPIVRKLVKNRQVFHCSIDGYNLRIGKYKVTKTWAIKFANWILKSFEKQI